MWKCGRHATNMNAVIVCRSRAPSAAVFIPSPWLNLSLNVIISSRSVGLTSPVKPSALGVEVRTDYRAAATTTSSAAKRPLASG
jgi:hypothetical protein